jgi:POT family proton-dependent oligopeptide transporter
MSPFIVGTLGEKVGWHYGFGAAGVGMIIALVVYIWGWKYLPAEGLRERKTTQAAKQPLDRAEWMSVGAMVLLVLPLTLWWACYEQSGNVISLFADTAIDRRVMPGIINWEIPVTWFQTFNPVMIFTFTPFLLVFWTRQAAALKEPNSMYKIILGCGLLALSYLLLAFAARTGGAARITWLWMLAFNAVLTTGEIYLSPISQSLYSKISPLRIVSVMMAVNFVPNFLGGGFLQGWLGTKWGTMTHSAFFLMIAAICLLSGVMVWAMEKPLRPYLEKSHD